ncbi:F-box/LRR-repeat MAX2 homolog A-like [Fagus crenata]
MAALLNHVHFHDLPDEIISNIFSFVTNTRTRNAISLVCLKWHLLECSTRTSLTLRGNIRDLFLVPSCFQAVTNLDLSFLSPWGHPLFDSSPNLILFAQLFRQGFPSLICWHQRLPNPLGFDFLSLLEHCHSLSSLDLSHFYYWTEDLPLALQVYPTVAASLTHLNILTYSSIEGYKSHELLAITATCSNLSQLLTTCIFDHRLVGFVGDETLLALASNCPRLSLLHLVDANSLSYTRINPDDDEGYTSEDARISHATLVSLCVGLPLLEELVLDVCHNVRDTCPAFDLLNTKCPQLKSLKLGQFHAISLGCTRLTKFEVHGCKRITELGLKYFSSILHKTIIDVKISCCKHLNAVCSLHALEPIRELIQRLHIDCVWERNQQLEEKSRSQNQAAGNKYIELEKRMDDRFSSRTWAKFYYLSLRISVGELLSPLSTSLVGLENFPVLEEKQIQIEGDCRKHPSPSMHAFGLSSLECYPRLSKMKLDCGGAIGYAFTAPYGYADLSLWERFYLKGEVNQRTISLPAAGLLAQCVTLRKLFIHGTANEHFIRTALPISVTDTNLKDVQLREDYYPAPENDMSTEMRVHSCYQFEDALNSRQIPN